METTIQKNRPAPAPSCIYFMGVIGAAIFYISKAVTFWTGVLGFLKALIWPVFLVYEAFKQLGSV